MQITKISVHYGRTQSLPDYCNVKPGVSFEATLEPGDDPEAVKAELQRLTQAHVEEECDLALEGAGLPAKFDQGPRYDAIRVSDEKYIAIVSSDADLPELWDKSNRVETGWRLGPLMKLLDREWSSHLAEDFSQNPEALPDLVQIQIVLTRRLEESDPRYCVVLPYSVEADRLGEPYRYLPRRYYTIFAVSTIAFISKYARDNEAELVDCLDGDLSRLPDLAPKESPKVEIEPDYEEPIDDDDDDDWEDDDYEGEDD